MRMSRGEYRAWAEQQGRGRFERVDGEVVAMAPERASHAARKARAWLALHRAVLEAGLPCEVYPDGMTVEVGDSDYEPDVVLHCGTKLPPDAISVPNPMVIVEVLSPRTRNTDLNLKLAEYFRLPSLHHYLVIRADKRQITHHRHGADGRIELTIVTAGEIPLDPPGVTIALDDIYAA